MVYSRQKRQRGEPAIPQPGILTSLPRPPIAIDYFEPKYWNNDITPRDRIRYVRAGVKVALPKKEFCRNWTEIMKWKDLDDAAFMAGYGNAVLTEFTIPTQTEINNYDGGEEDEVEEQLQTAQPVAGSSTQHMEDIS